MQKQLPTLPPQNVFDLETNNEAKKDVLESIGLYDCYQKATNKLNNKTDEVERKR